VRCVYGALIGELNMPRTHGEVLHKKRNPLLRDRGERRCGSEKFVTRMQNSVCVPPEETGPVLRRQKDCHWK
jgi:hypothetical protein